MPTRWCGWFGFHGRDAGENHRLAVQKLGDQREAPAHCFNVASQRRNQKVTALFQAGYLVLKCLPASPVLRDERA